MKLPEFNRTLRQLVALPIVLLVLMAGFEVWQILAATQAHAGSVHGVALFQCFDQLVLNAEAE